MSAPWWQLSKLHWYSFLIFVGAGSIAVEITGLRLLAPLFGSSLPVWGMAIAIVLAGLAWGYTVGGRRAAHSSERPLVFQYAALAAALFLWLPAVFRLALLARNLWLEQGQLGLLPAVLVLSGSALLLPSFVFGMVTPLAVQTEAMRRGQTAGQSAGRVFTLTTIGSLLGILIPSFITIPLLGTRATVWLFASAILLQSLPVLARQWRYQRTGAVLLLLALPAAVWLPVPAGDIIYAAETAHQYVAVRQRGERRLLTYDASVGIQSLYTPQIYTEGYWDYLAALPALLAPPDEDEVSVLVLGAAASTTERQMVRLWGTTKAFTFTSVELDEDILDIAADYFDPPPRRTVAADARAFVTRDRATYDLIIVDAYARELTIPFHLTTVEFFEQVARRLAPGGIVAINTNATSRDTLWIQSISRTVGHILPAVGIASIPQSCNHLVLAAAAPWVVPAKSALPPAIAPLYPILERAVSPTGRGLVLTDDRAPTDALGILALLQDQSGCG